ncbi:hypothetical protein I6N90_12990 [Paenibacillus sp. GSMTC-2017]|uniref:hypothetical protein n=1 Tax=Paenibacillus sp. GSMTC-2017 TaxID=2794350 RepID=UPI0018D6C8C2|nr:hypothetical protein [Paenibacillus sp. GSMTC-2017]MBH5318715.1 hypothetical protein [Paenibacillus sp. GSMTC-2017]
MASEWATKLLLGFGIVVAIIGVLAYLRLFRKEKLTRTTHSRADVTPPSFNLANKNVANDGDEISSEDEPPRD